MLFLVKNDVKWTLVFVFFFVVGAYEGVYVLDLEVRIEPGRQTVRDVLLGGLAVAASDGLLHGFSWLALGSWYRGRYRALADFFRFQGLKEILAAGFLAAAEEMVFRGVLLESLIQKKAWPVAGAVGVSAIAFGLCHLIPSRLLWPFVFWAVWEGVLLGGIYVLSGSLLVCMIVHFLHDVGGFTLFVYQRRHWRKNEE